MTLSKGESGERLNEGNKVDISVMTITGSTAPWCGAGLVLVYVVFTLKFDFQSP